MHRTSPILLATLALPGCAEETTDASTSEAIGRGGSTVPVCKVDDDDSYFLSQVSSRGRALDAQLANGGVLPGDYCEDADGDGVGAGAITDCPTDAWPTASVDGDCDDAFPEDASETADTDGDGVGDNSDACPTELPMTDADGDGCEDATSNLNCDCSTHDACVYDSAGALRAGYTLPVASSGGSRVDIGLSRSGESLEICPGDWSVRVTANSGDYTITGAGADQTFLSDRAYDCATTLPGSLSRYGNGTGSQIDVNYTGNTTISDLSFSGNCGGERLVTTFGSISSLTLQDVGFYDNYVGTYNDDHGLIWAWSVQSTTLDGVEVDGVYDLLEAVSGVAWRQGNALVVYQPPAGATVDVVDSSFSNVEDAAFTSRRNTYGATTTDFTNVAFGGNGTDWFGGTLGSPFTGTCTDTSATNCNRDHRGSPPAGGAEGVDPAPPSCVVAPPRRADGDRGGAGIGDGRDAERARDQSVTSGLSARNVSISSKQPCSSAAVTAWLVHSDAVVRRPPSAW